MPQNSASSRGSSQWWAEGNLSMDLEMRGKGIESANFANAAER